MQSEIGNRKSEIGNGFRSQRTATLPRYGAATMHDGEGAVATRTATLPRNASPLKPTIYHLPTTICPVTPTLLHGHSRDGEAHPSCDRLRGSLRSGDMSPLPTTIYQLPTTNYQLPTTNYQLPTTNYQLPNGKAAAELPQPFRSDAKWLRVRVRY